MRIAQFCFVLGLAAHEALASPLNPYPDVSTSPPLKHVVPRTHIRHEKRTLAQGNAWSKVERAKREVSLPMRIGLKQRNLVDGHNLLMDM